MPIARLAPRSLSTRNTATSINFSRPADHLFVDRRGAHSTRCAAYPGHQPKRNHVDVLCSLRPNRLRRQSSVQLGTDCIWIMSSDDTYSSFLDQVNQDTGASKVSSESNAATAKVTDTDVPMELQHVDQYYTSEADEPFEPVSLQWNGKNMPSEGSFNVS